MTRDAQRLAALEKANAIRTNRARLKQKAAIGKADARELLHQPPPCVEGVHIVDFLRWFPRVGKIKAARIVRTVFNGVPAAGNKEIGRLSPATKERILELMPAGRE